jgi:hypothetical protein
MLDIVTLKDVCDVIVIPLCGIAIIRSLDKRGE